MIFRKLLGAVAAGFRRSQPDPEPAPAPKPPRRKSRSRSRRRGPRRPPTAAAPTEKLEAPTKAETALLEPFPGLPLEHIHVPKTREAFEQAAREILAAGVAGFDTESKPVFRVGETNHGPHVVQFALRDRAFIFQLHRAGCRDLVSDLLHSDQVLKVGFGLSNDRGQIRSKFGIDPQAILDLEHVFRRRGYTRQIGVRGAIAALLHQSFPKSKTVTTSNWAAPDLTPRQLLYAANDAYGALRVMEALDLDATDR